MSLSTVVMHDDAVVLIMSLTSPFLKYKRL